MPAELAIGRVTLSPTTPRIVAAGGEREIEALARADGADVVELRADLSDDPRPESLPSLLARLGQAGRPVILTARAAAEGGRPMEDARRHELYLAGLAHADAIDVEIASATLVAELVPRAHASGQAVILSAHFLDRTPPADELIALVARARALGADVVKLAAHARDLAELRTLVHVTVTTVEHGVATLALGPAGPLSRLVLPAAGSLLTYGHVGRPTAPSGQLPVCEVVELVRRLFPR